MKHAKTLALVLALVLIAALALPVSASADDVAYSVIGTSMTFVKDLVMDSDAHVPSATFSFSVAPGTAVPASEGKAAVKAGIGTPTIANVVFDGTEQTTAGTPSSADDTTKKYASKTGTADFSSITFTEPGIYRYVITESGTNLGVTNEDPGTRTLDVYVVNAANGGLEIASYVLYSGSYEPAAGTGTATEPTGKNAPFVNEYDTANLELTKTVTGNLGSHDKYFKFTVVISGATAGTKYDVDLSNADTTVAENAATDSSYVGKTNPTLLTVEDNGSVTGEFYLQHGQSVTIKGIANGTEYTITEENEDYTVTKTGDQGTVGSEDITAAFTNDLSGQIPTGLMLSVAPFALLMLLGGAGILLMLRKAHRA